MSYSEDHIALAAEYALGTLDAEERAQVESMMAIDGEFRLLVERWEAQLGELTAMVGAVEPPPSLWHRVRDAALSAQGQLPLVLPELPAPPPPPQEPAPAPAPDISGQLAALANAARRWRGVTVLVSALAACLLALAVVQAMRSDWLPAPLRPKPVVTTVQVPPPLPSQFIAVLQKGAEEPAFILTLDIATKTCTVRRLGAEPEQGKSYELWLVSDKLPQPRSLGVIGSTDFTVSPSLAEFDAETINRATYAVSVEPEGGSPTGVATGPIVFTGKLVETVPSSSQR